MKKSSESWACLDWRKDDREHLIDAYKYLKGRHHKDGARLSSLLLSSRTKGNRHKLKHGTFHLNIKKNFLEVV